MSDVKANSDALAEISIAAAWTLIDELKKQDEMMSLFNHIEESKTRAEGVKSLLETTPTFAVTKTFGTVMDKQLKNIGVMDTIPSDVEGVEALGFTLSPQAYLTTRIAGCESFITKAAKQTAALLTMMGESVRNRYVLLMESNASLKKRLTALEREINVLPPMKEGAKKIEVKSNASLFVVNGTIRPDWGTQFEKVEKTIKALIHNYYKSNQWTVNDLLSYFGGFSDLSEEDAFKRFKTLPTALKGLRFDECIYPNRNDSTPDVRVRNSVELMGGYVFTNATITKTPKDMRSIGEIKEWIHFYITAEHVKFERLPKPQFEEPPVIPSFSTAQIKTGIKITQRILTETESIFSAGDKYNVLGTDYTDIAEMLDNSDWSPELKGAIILAFDELAMKYNKELLAVRSSVVEYLTLLINAYIKLVLVSIE